MRISLLKSLFLFTCNISAFYTLGQIGSNNGNGNGNLQWRTNGNSADTNFFIGTTNQRDLKFKVNNIERVRFTENGNVGIGVLNPQFRLDINGALRLSNGDLILNNLAQPQLNFDEFLIIKPTGLVERADQEMLLSLVYGNPSQPKPCPGDLNGIPVYLAPSWQRSPQKMYLLNNECLPDVKLGVGIVPDAKLHIKTTYGIQTKPIIIEDHTGNKLLQLNSDGLLYAREIKVNLDTAWPDYVFNDNYALMPLDELKKFILQYKHLPNIPTASEMEANGINVAETNVQLMEKVEELTIYLIQLQEELKRQNEIIRQQQEQIQAITNTQN